MIQPIKTLRKFALATALSTATILSGVASSYSAQGTVKLLTANFASRNVVQVEAGDFHFKPGQVAPVHTHSAPAIGYVAKGSIIYQVEGEEPQLLRKGDAFFEPTDVRILRFDNASATHEAIFLDFNLEQAGEPFIVFEKPLTEKIDRRTLPTVKLEGHNINRADIYANELEPAGILKLTGHQPSLGLVAEGVVELRISGQAPKRIAAGETFALTKVGIQATLINVSSQVKANVITFKLQ